MIVSSRHATIRDVNYQVQAKEIASSVELLPLPSIMASMANIDI
jgi:hypothetical protein